MLLPKVLALRECAQGIAKIVGQHSRLILLCRRSPVPAYSVAAIRAWIRNVPNDLRDKTRLVLLKQRLQVAYVGMVLDIVVIKFDRLRQNVFGQWKYDCEFRGFRLIENSKTSPPLVGRLEGIPPPNGTIQILAFF
jgi:hypothetical protein